MSGKEMREIANVSRMHEIFAQCREYHAEEEQKLNEGEVESLRKYCITESAQHLNLNCAFVHNRMEKEKHFSITLDTSLLFQLQCYKKKSLRILNNGQVISATPVGSYNY